MKEEFAVRVSLRLCCVLRSCSFALLLYICRHSNATVRIFLFTECLCSTRKRMEFGTGRMSAGDECIPVIGENRPRRKTIYQSVSINKVLSGK